MKPDTRTQIAIIPFGKTGRGGSGGGGLTQLDVVLAATSKGLRLSSQWGNGDSTWPQLNFGPQLD